MTLSNGYFDMSRCRLVCSARGFTLLEVMVAFVIFATVGLTAFSWINTSMTGVQRVRDVNERTRLTRNALELLALKNPMQEPDGDITCNDETISWSSFPLVQPMMQGRGGLYRLGLYRVDVVIEEAEGHDEIHFSFVREGYRQEAEGRL